MNTLSGEQSPYLLKHASNPVHWHPWSEEALKMARELDRPIFLSIGYTTCHWCNVMEEESFSDPEVAGLLNATFICIKVDREERPDIDGIYMAACNLLTGSGGWPLTMLLTPEGKPFHAATYLPKHSRFGRMGLMDLIPRVADMWGAQRAGLLESASKITGALAEAVHPIADDEPFVEADLDEAYKQLRSAYDAKYGGFGSGMKFPMPHTTSFLLRYHKRQPASDALEMALGTLDGMLRGGMRDHLAGGFHRYSTDARWLVPHFEKMLYDQALIAVSLTEAYQLTRELRYADAARDTLEFALATLQDPDGAFYTALGADSEGEEGTYYLWGSGGLDAILGPSDAAYARRVFGFEEGGNFEDSVTGERSGLNIIHLAEPADDMPRIAAIRQRLLEARAKRPAPELDDKVLCDVNGLMIAALCVYARATGRAGYAEQAARAARFVLDTMRDGQGRLMHGWRRGGVPKGSASADDYAFMLHGLTELYLSTFDVLWLDRAVELMREMIKSFWDERGGGFYFTPFYGEHGIIRKKEVYDSAVPSSNSVAAMCLLRLGRITANADWEHKAARLMRAFSGNVREHHSSYACLMSALDFGLGPSNEVVVAGRCGSPDTEAMLRKFLDAYLPNTVVLYLEISDTRAPVLRYAGYMEGMELKAGRAAAYVCRGYTCRMPTADPAEALGLLSA